MVPPHSSVVDLTCESEDESTGIDRWQNQKTTSYFAQGFSNDGLPSVHGPSRHEPSRLETRISSEMSDIAVLGQNYLLNPQQKRSKNSNFGVRASSSSLQTYTMGEQHDGSHRSLVYLQQSDIENVEPQEYRSAPVQPNSGIKRQKTAHESLLPRSQFQSSSQQPRNNVPPSRRNNLQQSTSKQTAHDGAQVGRPPASLLIPPQQSRAPPQPSRTNKNVNEFATSGQTVITGASRAAFGDAAARVSSVERVQKPKTAESQTGLPASEFTAAIEAQVIPLVRDAIRPFKGEFSWKERTDIGQKIAGELVSDPSYKENIETNNYRMSVGYEKLTIKKAKARANHYFRLLRKDRESEFRNDPPSDQTTREVSTEPEELFDTHRSHRSQQSRLSRASLIGAQSRGHSPSPGTSVTNDAADATSLEGGDMDEAEPVRNTLGVSKSLPARSTQAGTPPLTRTRQKRKLALQNEDRSSRGIASSEVTSRNGKRTRQASRLSSFDSATHIEVHPPRNPSNQATAFKATDLPRALGTPSAILPAVNLSRSIVFRAVDPIGNLLRQRELHGMTPVRARRGQSSFKAVATSYLEDCYVRQSEWTDCSGTILSLTWTSADAFICGAVAHSDLHHMQYNKPGNLLLGSISQDTLRSFPDHRLIRPIVSASQNASNAQEAMRQTQDPWLYTPVATTAHSEKTGYTFTASFDKTVKVWTVMADGSSMELRGTWFHDERVNFVVTSQHHDRVATASESMSNAVRVYNLDDDAISDSPYDVYCGNKASSQGEEIRRREKWAYQPSTIQWGLADRVKHLLLVGWSPRSESGDDADIPEDKRNTGELCIWNMLDSTMVQINSAHTQNVFEVIWHPNQPFFLAATSPSGNFDVDTTKTQIRLFGLNATGGFINNRTFDCSACDINELTIMPTSAEECFVTASCTDRCTYVYDSKRGDQPIHVLQHGESLDEPENEDSGVKFAAWGNSSDRFYTGSSDGQLKAWNIKAPPGKAFVRDILKLSGGIYAGSFFKDFSKLLIGDDTGKVHLLAIDDSDLVDEPKSGASTQAAVTSQLATLSSGLLPSNIKRPKLIIPHPEPPNPYAADDMVEVEQTSAEISIRLLEEGQLCLLPNREFPHARRAVYQGPNYGETLWYRFEAHESSDCSEPLLPEYLNKQQFLVEENERLLLEKNKQLQRQKKLKKTTLSLTDITKSQKLHRDNLEVDLDFEKLSLSTQESLLRDRVEFEGDFIFDWETTPSRKHVFLGG